jgi:hypothetical protein
MTDVLWLRLLMIEQVDAFHTRTARSPSPPAAAAYLPSADQRNTRAAY